MSAISSDIDLESARVVANRLSRTVTLGNGHRLEVVREVSLRVGPAESVAVVGRSGSGKSSLLAMLGLLSAPDAGTVLVDGIECTTLPDAAKAQMRNRRIGFVFQSYSLVPHLSAAENVELPLLYGDPTRRRHRARRVREVLGVLGLGDRADSRPKQLSGGEQQRVAIARALVRAPGLILADEPTGALDTATAATVLEALLRGASETGTSLVLVTHDPDIAARADRTMTMTQGQLTQGQSVTPS